MISTAFSHNEGVETNDGKTLPWALSHGLKLCYQIRNYENETVINPTVQNMLLLEPTCIFM